MSDQIRNEGIKSIKGNGRSQKQSVTELVADGEYEALQNILYRSLKTAELEDDVIKVNILAAAYQICVSCNRHFQEIEAYQQAYEDAVAREHTLRQQLVSIIQIIEDEEELVCISHPFLPETIDSQLSFRQRLQNLFWGKRPELESNNNDQFTIPQVANPKSLEMNKIPSSPNPPPLTESESALSLQVEGKIKQSISFSAKEIPHLTVYCLGVFQIYEDEHLIDEWSSKKGKAIFKYLLMNRHQSVAKEVLMDMFWPESSVDAARNNLNVAIYGLRQTLRNGYPDFSHVLFQNDHYLLNPMMTIWLDVDAFFEYFERAQTLNKQNNKETAVREYHAAETLYQGEFLAEDRYEEWIFPIRQTVQEKYLQILAILSDYYYERSAYTNCIEFCQKTLAIESCQEKAHRRLMRAYCHIGHDYLALRQYHHCVSLLRSELEVTPESRTDQLYESIRQHEPSARST